MNMPTDYATGLVLVILSFVFLLLGLVKACREESLQYKRSIHPSTRVLRLVTPVVTIPAVPLHRVDDLVGLAVSAGVLTDRRP